MGVAKYLPGEVRRVNHSTGVQVEEVLAMVPGARVLAGSQGLHRLVHSVGVLEGPDTLELLKPSDLVLTALWAIRDDRAAQLRLVPELIRRGVAALAIKLRYVNELPAEVLEQADQNAFPLLQLTSDMPYSEVMLPIIGQIVNRQALVLARQQTAHKAVMQAVLEAKGLHRLAETLAELLENPVVIRDQMGQVLAVGHREEDGRRPDLQTLARLEPRATDYMLSAGDTVHGLEVVHHKGRRLTRVVTPVKTGNTQYGQVQVWEMGRQLADLDLSIIDSVTTVIALELTNRRALVEVERRYYNEFLAALLTGHIESEGDMLIRAGRMGWDLERPHYAVAIKFTVAGDRAPQDVQAMMSLQDHLYDLVVRSLGPGAVVGQAELYTVILLPPSPTGDGRDERLTITRQLQEQAAALGEGATVTLGVGTVHSSIQGLRRSFQEARQAVSIGERVSGPGGVFHYADLGLFPILAMLEPTPELHQFLSGVRRLAGYDAKHRTELSKTLETYFACKGNVRKVSEQLFAHYNTILYRLERIEQITGLSLEDPDSRLYLNMALRAVRLFGTEEPAPDPGD